MAYRMMALRRSLLAVGISLGFACSQLPAMDDEDEGSGDAPSEGTGRVASGDTPTSTGNPPSSGSTPMAGTPVAGGATPTASAAASSGAMTAEKAEDDEFTSADSMTDWQRVWQVEGWPHDQLEHLDIGETRSGWLTMEPYTSAWFGDYRGVLMFKLITGDFVVSTNVATTGRSGSGAPSQLYSLAGIMVRAPKARSAAAWQPGEENYIFLAHGSADQPGQYQTEVKTTTSSVSNLEIDAAEAGSAELRTARIGSAIIVMIRHPGQEWRIHRRYSRPDLPAALQVGMTAYTDWSHVETRTPAQHNTVQILDGTPDLRAQFDYFRFAAVTVPDELSGRDLTDPAATTDAELLELLGE